MTQRHALKIVASLCVVAFVQLSADKCDAQLIRAPLTDGFSRTSSVDISVDEMLGSRKVRKSSEPILGPGYPALTTFEIQYKPVRMLRMSVVDPESGKSSRELVWYMVYRLIARDYTELAGSGRADLLQKLSDPNHDPQNAADEVNSNPVTLPRFILHVDDKGAEKEHMDELNLQVQRSVFQREFGRRGQQLKLHNSVEGILEFPDPVPTLGPEADPNPLDQAIYGVAIWRGIDARTDYFTVYMSGITNAYRISTDADGNQVVEEKVVEQRFARPGDEFLQEEQEFRLEGKPQWIYRPRNVQLSVPDVDTVLRNAKAAQDGNTTE